jgi:hypothetical protein
MSTDIRVRLAISKSPTHKCAYQHICVSFNFNTPASVPSSGRHDRKRGYLHIRSVYEKLIISSIFNEMPDYCRTAAIHRLPLCRRPPPRTDRGKLDLHRKFLGRTSGHPGAEINKWHEIALAVLANSGTPKLATREVGGTRGRLRCKACQSKYWESILNGCFSCSERINCCGIVPTASGDATPRRWPIIGTVRCC